MRYFSEVCPQINKYSYCSIRQTLSPVAISSTMQIRIFFMMLHWNLQNELERLEWGGTHEQAG